MTSAAFASARPARTRQAFAQPVIAAPQQEMPDRTHQLGGNSVTTLIGPHGWIVDEAGEITLAASAPGVIGGAIIRAARRSVDLSRQDLADMLAVDPDTVRGWEPVSARCSACPTTSSASWQMCSIMPVLASATKKTS